ncbi:MAG: RagB/SusD family nutrient uptake outer membrane protein, partial [Flavisolibacter sp.]
LSNSVWASLRDPDRRMYTWEKDQLFPLSRNEWSGVYDKVYIANSVLEGLNKVEKGSGNTTEWDNIKGQALFLRAESFLQAAFIWTLAYDPATANSDPGLPLRLNSDFNITSTRSSNQQTYDQIINDLKAAIPLLPVVPVLVMRSSKPAGYGLMARTYLAMRDYDLAKKYADSCLALNNTLLDYNTIPTTGTFNITLFNAEVLYHAQMAVPAPLISSNAKIDTALYQSYDTNDLRKEIFFKKNADGSYGFYGNYTHSAALFSGIATDEIYLVRAECNAREGNTTEALNDLNNLLSKRWKTGTFTPYTAANTSDALNKILNERRKELLMRGLRWMDIKRFNKEGANITLTRILNGQTYILNPNDPRFALPIPEDVIELSGMPQNPR